MRKTAALLLFAAATTGQLAAQTNDHDWRGPQVIEDVGSPRAAGMGGAFTGLADDPSAVANNPAGIADLDATEIQASVLNRASGSVFTGDTSASRTGIGFIGGAGKVSKEFAIAGYIAEPLDLALTLVQTGRAGAADSGFHNARLTDVGAAVAWAPLPHLYLGLRGSVVHLRLESLLTHRTGTVGSYDAASSAAQDRLTGDFGILYRPSDKWAAGLSLIQGARFDATRTARAAGQTAPTASYQVSSASRLSGGASVRPTPKLLFVGQVDIVLQHRLVDTLQIVQGAVGSADYVLDNEVEVRAGAELSIPVHTVTIQVRGGIDNRPTSSFRYVGSVPAEAQTFFGSSSTTLGTAGASIVGRRLRLDVAGTFGGGRTVLTGGAAVRL